VKKSVAACISVRSCYLSGASMNFSSYASGAHGADKRSLAAILRSHGPLPVMDAIDVTLDVCDELANAHMNNVVHGDLGVHRVRTSWPRYPGEPVDIFALGETDTAAFEVRISAGSILVAPEQKDGRVVDARADIFCVGVMLHWLITGAPPGLAPLHVTLRSAPRPVIATIEACLAHDPAHRPASIDDVAEALGSFAASPPDRFAQIARRRLAQANAKLVRKDYDQLSVALRRLDDAAISREVSAATQVPGPQETLVMFSVQSLAAARRRAQTDRYPHRADAGATWGSEAETLARPSYREPARGYYPDDPAERLPPPLPVSPEFLSPDSVIAEDDVALYSDHGAPRPRVASVPPLSYDTPQTLQPPRRSPWSSVFGFVATALVVACVVGGAAHLSARMASDQTHASKAHPTKRATKAASAGSAANTASSPATTTPADVQGGPVASAPLPPAGPPPASANGEPPVSTPAGLPNARPGRTRGRSVEPRVKSGGAARSTPANPSSSTPPSAPAAREAGPAREAAPAPPEKEKEKDFNVTPSVLSDALR
jgi:hypothetical protein